MNKAQHLKDPGSAITHFIGTVMAICGAIPLLIKAAREPGRVYLISLAVYAISLILLYAASTTYHTFDISAKVNTVLKKIDHMMIFILIAGSYTPICLITLNGRTGVILLSIGRELLRSVFWSKPFGCIVRSGYLPFSISEWDGPAYWPPPQRSLLPVSRRIWLAAGRRHHLYDRWYYLRTKASDLQQ